MTVTTVVCDLGGVVLRTDTDRIRHAWARRSRLATAEVLAAYPDRVYEAFERDEVDERRYLAHIRDQLALDGSDEELAADFNELFLGVEPAVIDLLAAARRRGLLVAALSNTNRIHQRVWSDRYAEQLQVFHAVHCSHELGARKPEAAAYRRVLAAHGVAPSQACFIDDAPAYVAAARRLGLHGLYYRDPPRLARQLADLGVLDHAEASETSTISGRTSRT